mmetsp:Transcript_39103/g.62442  ORF Transcript_39103/g.62442 Transcript_39103/m.62442 type:complete len:259 (-) Transcript_39103:344-1120(-)|eukprot:CAMPEP_0197039450 /NCGR_PEP_ID=MMETSP1384-20130603/16230_1 /TAXON_ID=29189 /ORGANISM="Ammonia sp." /LENGTH=258 /DNA_ID=CAMNT_0042470045 /DNA_START=118 /DNA_END=894 /DNA_ORIENTATION=-
MSMWTIYLLLSIGYLRGSQVEASGANVCDSCPSFESYCCRCLLSEDVKALADVCDSCPSFESYCCRCLELSDNPFGSEQDIEDVANSLHHDDSPNIEREASNGNEAFSGDGWVCGSYPCGEYGGPYCNGGGYCRCTNGQPGSYPCGVGGDPHCNGAGYCCCVTSQADQDIEHVANSLYHGESPSIERNGKEALIGNSYLIISVAMLLFCACVLSRFYSRCKKPAKSIHDEASNQSHYGSIASKQADDDGQVDGKAIKV